nr:general transcription factor IIE subunit 1-like [Macaca nemestrina]
MADPDVLTEVPAALKRLAKYVIRGFYGIEHALVLEILIRNPFVKEEFMLELLKFDRKQLRSVLNNLLPLSSAHLFSWQVGVGYCQEASAPHSGNSPEGSLNVLMTWRLTSPRMRDPGDNEKEATKPLRPHL